MDTLGLRPRSTNTRPLNNLRSRGVSAQSPLSQVKAPWSLQPSGAGWRAGALRLAVLTPLPLSYFFLFVLGAL